MANSNPAVERITYESVVSAAGQVDFMPRIREIADFLSGGNEELMVSLASAMAVLIEPIEDDSISPDTQDFEDWLARKGLEATSQATQYDPTIGLLSFEHSMQGSSSIQRHVWGQQ